MMRSLTAIAVVIAALFAATSCNDYGNTFQGNTGANITFISPSNTTACVSTATVTCPDLTITLNDTFNDLGFVKNTFVTWDQAKIKTIPLFDSAGNLITTQISAVVPAADLTKPGTTHFVQTQSPFSGAGNNGLSNSVAFFVNPVPNPVPTIASISPNTAAAGSAVDVQITITGTNFIKAASAANSSQVNWNTTSQASLAVTNTTSTQIQATVPAALLASAGTASVTVYNPPAPPAPNCTPGNCGGNGGGGTSSCPLLTGSTTVTVCTFTITGAGGAAKANAATVEEETPAISQDGRYVAYSALQSGHSQIFVRDTCQGADSSCQPRTVLISSALDGIAASDDSRAPSMSSDGRYVAFSSAATNLVAETASAAPGTGRQVYLRDTCFGASATCSPTTQLISTDPNGTLGGTESILPSVSSSGRFVAFLAVTQSHAAQSTAAATKLATNTPNSGFRQVFIRDTCLATANCTPTTTRISLQPGDGSNSTTKPAGPAISGTADHLALAGGNTATLFTRSVAVDDGVFLALTKNKP